MANPTAIPPPHSDGSRPGGPWKCRCLALPVVPVEVWHRPIAPQEIVGSGDRLIDVPHGDVAKDRAHLEGEPDQGLDRPVGRVGHRLPATSQGIAERLGQLVADRRVVVPPAALARGCGVDQSHSHGDYGVGMTAKVHLTSYLTVGRFVTIETLYDSDGGAMPTQAAARTWLDRWDHQQELYMADREERFAVMADVIDAVIDRPDPLILDLGCGPGSTSVRMLDRLPGAEVVGLDADPFLLGLARRLRPPARAALRRP